MLSTNLLIINIISILLMLVGLSVSSMRCYQCHSNDNRLCLQSGSQDCPPNQAYDRCMTTIYRNPKDGLHIKKECALAPCHLRDSDIRDLLSFDESCKNNDEDCIHCCKTDGCNTDGVNMISAHNLLIASMVSIVITIIFFSNI